MKIKEISAGVKLTKNYDSYHASLTAEIEAGENPEKIGEELMKTASLVVNKKMGESKFSEKARRENSEIEVGAAWMSKESKNKLSVQYAKGGKWEDIKIEELEKTEKGFKQKIGEDTFIFRRISEKERTNDKMPVYRIYKIEGENE